MLPELPLGTLAANLVGGLLIGARDRSSSPTTRALAPEMRLLRDHRFPRRAHHVLDLLRRGGHAARARAVDVGGAHIGSHLFASITLTIAGMYAVRWLKG